MGKEHLFFKKNYYTILAFPAADCLKKEFILFTEKTPLRDKLNGHFLPPMNVVDTSLVLLSTISSQYSFICFFFKKSIVLYACRCNNATTTI